MSTQITNRAMLNAVPLNVPQSNIAKAGQKQATTSFGEVLAKSGTDASLTGGSSAGAQSFGTKGSQGNTDMGGGPGGNGPGVGGFGKGGDFSADGTSRNGGDGMLGGFA